MFNKNQLFFYIIKMFKIRPIFYDKIEKQDINANLEQKLNETKKAKADLDEKIKILCEQHDKMEKMIKYYEMEIEKNKNKSKFDKFKNVYVNIYGNEPYFNTFEELYNTFKKSDNVKIEIVENEKGEYSMLIESKNLKSDEQLMLNVMKKMFEHINDMICDVANDY